jgi:hypothetical protein
MIDWLIDIFIQDIPYVISFLGGAANLRRNRT